MKTPEQKFAEELAVKNVMDRLHQYFKGAIDECDYWKDEIFKDEEEICNMIEERKEELRKARDTFGGLKNEKD